jgi:hypothetical protein
MASGNPLLILDVNGAPRISPSVSSRWTFDEGSVSRFIAQRDVVLMSYMEGGPANELVAFIDLHALQETYDPEALGILGADLASYLKTPSFDLNIRGAYRIYVLRLGHPTSASLMLLDGASAQVLQVTSLDAGTYANKNSIQVSTGSVVGKKITLRFRQELLVLDNLQNAFHLAYTGNGTVATVTITRQNDRAIRLQTTLTGATDGSIALDLDLTQDAFATVQQLATYINGQNGYRARLDRYGDPLLPSAELDTVAGGTIRTPVALVIRYVGAGTAATMTVTNTTLTTAVTGGPGGQNLSVTFSDPTTDTLGELIAYINSFTGVYTCALGPDADPEALTPSLLTNVTAQDIRTATYSLTAQAGKMDTVLHAALGTIVWAINTRANRVSATRRPAAITVPANLAQTFLSGGTNPVPTNNDWLDGLDVIEQEDLAGALVFPVSTSPVVQDGINAWLSEQHTNEGKSFRGFFAPPDFTSADDAKAIALGLNSTFAAMIPQAMVAASGTTEQPPLYPVACYCGAAAGALPTQPVTRLVLRCRSLPTRSKFSKALREDLLSNGVCVLEEVKGIGVRVALAITTSLSQDRIDRILSESMARDVIEQRIKAYVEPLIPHWAMLDFMPTVKGSVYNALASLEADGIITKGIDANGKILPAWLPVQVYIHAGIMKIVVHVFIGGEVDHILIAGTISYQSFEITITAGA